jgi:multidrug efflux system outer membrane protein
MSKPAFHRASVAGLVVTMLAGCAAGPAYRPPAPPATGAFAGEALVPSVAGPVNARWWTLFDDAALAQLVDKALASNKDLAAADARLRAARALRRAQFADFLPVITSAASADSRRQSLRTVPSNFPVVRESDLYDAGFDASWELDLFGRTRRLNQAAKAEAGAAQASRDGVLLSVVAEVARNYFELRGAQEQLAMAGRNIKTQAHVLELIRLRESSGRGTALDSARAEAQVAATEASLPPLEAAASRALRRIEVLAGVAPGALAAELAAVTPLPPLPQELALGDAAGLLRRRPDVRSAERSLAADTARVGVAVADLFPRVSVNAGLGLSAMRVDALGDAGADRRNLGASLSWNVFDIVHLSQRLKAADAQADARLADYQQTVLTALEETENALSDYGRERQRLLQLERAAKASQLASDLATQRFETGVSDFLTALDAYRVAIEADAQRAASRTRASTLLVALFKSLGGGWETDPARKP